MPNNDKQEKLKKLLEVVNDGLSKAEFLKAFKAVTTQVLQLETKTLDKINKAIEDLKAGNSTSLEATQSDISDLTSKLEGLVAQALKEQENGMNFIHDKISKLKNGKNGTNGTDGTDGNDGKDVDEKKILKALKKKLPKVDKSEIRKLKKEIEELRRRPSGGGTSAMGVANAMKWILKTEEPVGLIDGANKTYTVSSTIFAVFAFSLNGEVVCQLPNYTIANKTITFATALPAAFAGKDFEIKYI